MNAFRVTGAWRETEHEAIIDGTEIKSELTAECITEYIKNVHPHRIWRESEH